MAIKFNRSQTFATNGTVTAPGLHNLVDGLDIYQALITDQTNLTSVGTADELLIADADLTANDAPRAVTVQELFNGALTVGTYTDANLTGNLTYGTATGNRTVSTNASITTGTINNATLGTTNGTAAIFTNATSTGANITNGTIQTLTSSTATITGGTFSGSINATAGTIGTLNSTTGTIGNFSTTLAGDITISQGTATIGTNAITETKISNLAVTPAKLSQPLTLATSVASTSGTAIDFTGIPSWAKRITIMFNGVSTNGTSPVAVQLGKSGGVETTGYSGFGAFVSASGTASNIVLNTANTIGFNLSRDSLSNDSTDGNATILNISGNTWVFTSNVIRQSTVLSFGNGAKTLGGTLDRVRITTVNGTDTFDAGSINIMYEG